MQIFHTLLHCRIEKNRKKLVSMVLKCIIYIFNMRLNTSAGIYPVLVTRGLTPRFVSRFAVMICAIFYEKIHFDAASSRAQARRAETRLSSRIAGWVVETQG